MDPKLCTGYRIFLTLAWLFLDVQNPESSTEPLKFPDSRQIICFTAKYLQTSKWKLMEKLKNLWNLLVRFFLLVRALAVKCQELSVCIKIWLFCIEAVHNMAFLAISRNVGGKNGPYVKIQVCFQIFLKPFRWTLFSISIHTLTLINWKDWGHLRSGTWHGPGGSFLMWLLLNPPNLIHPPYPPSPPPSLWKLCSPRNS